MIRPGQSPHRVLVIEGDGAPLAARVHATLAQEPGLSCEHVGWHALAPDALARHAVDLVVAVAVPAPASALRLFEWLAERPLPKPVFAILPADGDETLIRAATSAADDFLLTPIRALELRHRLQRLLPGPRHDLEDVRQHLLEEMGLTKLVGRDPAFLQAIRLLPRFARADATVLITGETGTGKELCARALHHLGPRRNFPFIAVDCGAVPDQLFENELFGHTRGAFTDAHRDQKGLVALADGGTLFLDEIDALSLGSQAKLLRFLQEHRFRPLGSERYDRADLRIIAATNRDLEACVRNKEVRADLYFRLNILRIHLPPLRQRRDDIPLLAQSMLEECRGRSEVRPRSLSSATLRILTLHDWPGNVRELRNVVQRALVECDGDTILPEHITLPAAAAPPPLSPFRAARAAVVAAFERHYVDELLRKHGGNVTHAAREAQQDRRAFGRFIKKYNIKRRSL